MVFSREIWNWTERTQFGVGNIFGAEIKTFKILEPTSDHRKLKFYVEDGKMNNNKWKDCWTGKNMLEDENGVRLNVS